MKKRTLRTTLFSILLVSASGLSSQVTIGSNKPPEKGALLQLTDGTTGDNGINAKKGLLIPRVKLLSRILDTTYDNLSKTINGNKPTDDWDAAKHIGLWVYNVSGEAKPQCAQIPDGIYVWDGEEWQGLKGNTSRTATLNISGNKTINFPSGMDLQTLATETFNVDWTPSNENLTYTNTGNMSFATITPSPLTGGNTTFKILPNAMTAAEIASNPFRTKEGILTFTAKNECGNPITETRTLNQTNKAMILATLEKDYKGSVSKEETNTLTTNADWVIKSIVPADNTNTISNMRLQGTTTDIVQGVTQTGHEQYNNTGKSANLTYDVTFDEAHAELKSRFSYITFADANPIPRFADVTLTVSICNNVAIQPTIAGWALIGGFTQAQIDNVQNTGNDSPILPTGLQLHRDQSGNLFLSSNFGTNATDSDQRWMIHNLAADKYASDSPIKPVLTKTYDNSTTNANYGYASGNGYMAVGAADDTKYKADNRIGLVYNWLATTGGQNTSTSDQGGLDYPPIQGICPNGWHLPSDKEFTTLETITMANASSFSSSATATTTNVGTVWKDICDRWTQEASNVGTANPLNNYQRPGFNLLLSGFATHGNSYGANEPNRAFGYLRSSSTKDDATAWIRIVGRAIPRINREAYGHVILLPIRCKKN